MWVLWGGAEFGILVPFVGCSSGADPAASSCGAALFWNTCGEKGISSSYPTQPSRASISLRFYFFSSFSSIYYYYFCFPTCYYFSPCNYFPPMLLFFATPGFAQWFQARRAEQSLGMCLDTAAHPRITLWSSGGAWLLCLARNPQNLWDFDISCLDLFGLHVHLLFSQLCPSSGTPFSPGAASFPLLFVSLPSSPGLCRAPGAGGVCCSLERPCRG